MAFDQQEVDSARTQQEAAAHAVQSQARLVAGPGTGKSATIEERVRWLLAERAIAPEHVFVVSFTRASAAELRDRIRAHCDRQGVANGNAVNVSTLHSLALRVLRRAGLLQRYPVSPIVLDDWELKHAWDTEFATRGGVTPSRAAEIRREYEALLSTGMWAPANRTPPDPPVSNSERQRFEGFHRPRTQVYACVLPGEIVRAAVDEISAGLLDAVELLDIEHLIVDEYQDLNPSDLEFVEHLIAGGVPTFVAGDDDQSIYSFRFADPTGIQSFGAQHAGAADYELQWCFRCAPAILEAAGSVIRANPLPNRIAKHPASLYDHANPRVGGRCEVTRYSRFRLEAAGIAQTAANLVAAGVDPSQILILLSDRSALADPITLALRSVGVPFEAPTSSALKDTDGGRAVLAFLRAACDGDDYVALRVLLGLLGGVGISTCAAIADAAIAAHANYRDLFYAPLPNGVFSTRQERALGRVRVITGQIAGWTADDTLALRGAEARALLEREYADADQAWDDLVDGMPVDTTLGELRDILWADSLEQASASATLVFERLELDVPDDVVVPSRVRVMTMHRAKGLSAQVVFIPGLEEEIFPGQWRAPYAGLVLEAARLLYVSITRARAACFVSFARRRTRFGQSVTHTPSRFVASLGVAATDSDRGLDAQEAAAVAAECASL
jgi:DNA helicase II / ATP-dependent DNA helicase PcrA